MYMNDIFARFVYSLLCFTVLLNFSSKVITSLLSDASAAAYVVYYLRVYLGLCVCAHLEMHLNCSILTKNKRGINPKSVSVNAGESSIRFRTSLFVSLASKHLIAEKKKSLALTWKCHPVLLSVSLLKIENRFYNKQDFVLISAHSLRA